MKPSEEDLRKKAQEKKAIDKAIEKNKKEENPWYGAKGTAVMLIAMVALYVFGGMFQFDYLEIFRGLGIVFILTLIVLKITNHPGLTF